MVDEITVCIFLAVVSFIFALKTESPYWFVFYSLVSGVGFAIAANMVLTSG
jgi:hypothetical protein